MLCCPDDEFEIYHAPTVSSSFDVNTILRGMLSVKYNPTSRYNSNHAWPTSMNSNLALHLNTRCDLGGSGVGIWQPLLDSVFSCYSLLGCLSAANAWVCVSVSPDERFSSRTWPVRVLSFGVADRTAFYRHRHRSLYGWHGDPF